MTSKERSLVKVQQCLFGYEDGHRLLATSLKLTNEVESTLLRLSDLAPGNIELTKKGYWTGIPLPSIKHYALLHTWPAPEMPRPGCVWTHVLLIGFTDIARFDDLANLAKLSGRPALDYNHNRYSQPLLVDAIKTNIEENISDQELIPSNLLKVLRAVYMPDEKHYLFAEANELDTSVFRIWSQQWPQLRRTFSFRTTGCLSEKPTAGAYFDLRILPKNNNHASEEQLIPLEPNSWEAVTLKDALSPVPTEFRKFLWRYGSDIHKGRTRFRFLASLYESTHQTSLIINSYDNTLLQVAEMLPELEDGKALKSDLVDGASNTYSLIPAVEPLESLTFFIKYPLVKGLPLPTDDTLSQLRKFWSTKSEQILALAEQAINISSILQNRIFSHIVELVEADDFLAATAERPNLRHRLITERPSLLNSESLLSVDQPELSKLLLLLPDDPKLVSLVVARLIYLNDQSVAEQMFMRFPKAVTQHVVKAVEMMSSKKVKDVPKVWLRTITKSTLVFLQGGYVENAQSLNTLVIFAEVIGYRNPEVFKAGPLPWATALIKSKDNVSEKSRNKLYTFFLRMVIEKPVYGCEPIFEHAFEIIHSALADDQLSHDACSLIAEVLPDLHWWRNWDMCHRLRLAVVNSYVNNKLEKDSFMRLTYDQALTNNLVELALNTKKGRSFLQN